MKNEREDEGKEPKATVQNLKELFEELAKPLTEILPKELHEKAITKTLAEQTKKGYDTTGYQYQFIVNRFNEVLPRFGLDFLTRGEPKIAREYLSRSGQKWFEATCHMTILLVNQAGIVLSERNCPGSHQSMNQGDALKGAWTNNFKKVAALYGVGRDAYEGTIDEDYLPIESEAVGPLTSVSANFLPNLTSEERSAIEKEIVAIENAETKKQLLTIEEQFVELVGKLSGKQIGFLRKLVEAKKAKL